MRPLAAAIAAALTLTLAVSSVVLADKPPVSCGAAASGFVHVDRDAWWDATVVGFEEEGIDVYEDDGVTFTAEFEEFLATVGFADGAAFEAFVRGEQWAVIDKNENGFLCMKEAPEQSNIPQFFFNAKDDNSSSNQG